MINTANATSRNRGAMTLLDMTIIADCLMINSQDDENEYRYVRSIRSKPRGFQRIRKWSKGYFKARRKQTACNRKINTCMISWAVKNASVFIVVTICMYALVNGK